MARSEARQTVLREKARVLNRVDPEQLTPTLVRRLYGDGSARLDAYLRPSVRRELAKRDG